MKFPFLMVRGCLLVLMAALLPAIRGAEATRARPNILWVVSEDNSYNYVGAYGDPLARTPHLDKLAAGGIVFERAYAPAPVCAPTRSSIITGRAASSLGTHDMRSTRPLPDGAKFFPEYLREAGYYCTNNAKTDYNTSTPFAQVWHENSRTAHYRNRTAGQPFFAVFNFEQSHESRLHTREKLVTDPTKVRVPAYLPDTPTVRADLAQYYDCVSRADEAIGAVLAQLAADGLADDTIVFYYSDHGGATPRSKRFLYENSTHAALIVRFPPKFAHLAPGAAGSRNRELVSLVDLAPTVLSLAGVRRVREFEGRAFAGDDRTPAPAFLGMFRNRMDERSDFSRAVTDGRWRYIRNYLPHLPAGQRISYLWRQASMQEWSELHRAGKLTPVQAAFFEPRTPEELFDCEADPDNVRNLAADPGHRGTLERMRTAHRAQLLQSRDTGFFPEAMLLGLTAGRSPTVIARDSALYPLERLIELTDSLQLAPESSAEKLAAALRDPLAIVRYWGVIGARRSRAETTASLHGLLADPDANVRIAAADIILQREPSPAAERVLLEALDPAQNYALRLESISAITRLPRIPAAFEAALAAAGAERSQMNGRENYVPWIVEALRPPAPTTTPR